MTKLYGVAALLGLATLACAQLSPEEEYSQWFARNLQYVEDAYQGWNAAFPEPTDSPEFAYMLEPQFRAAIKKEVVRPLAVLVERLSNPPTGAPSQEQALDSFLESHRQFSTWVEVPIEEPPTIENIQAIKEYDYTMGIQNLMDGMMAWAYGAVYLTEVAPEGFDHSSYEGVSIAVTSYRNKQQSD